MIKYLSVENFKSIEKLPIEFGRITVLIGENGSGKSNILEAIVLASASAANKLDNEFLASRGIRVTHPSVMRSAFLNDNLNKNIKLHVTTDQKNNRNFELENDNELYSSWRLSDANIASDSRLSDTDTVSELQNKFERILGKLGSDKSGNEKILVTLKKLQDSLESVRKLEKIIKEHKESRDDIKLDELQDFLIYSPENSSLRQFEMEGQIEPLGIKGEGLFKLLSVLANDPEAMQSIKNGLEMLGWFKDFKLSDTHPSDRKIEIQDRFIDSESVILNQRSANEGFLFLLFYLALFTSKNTPRFFAIDNIEASFNPKLCEKLIQELSKLAKKFNKQVIFTTHNPSVLDGLNLDDPEQILYVVSRSPTGKTKLKRIKKHRPIEGTKPTKLSAAFMRGTLGGLPKGF
jgi:predicted ATPase